MVQFNQNRCFEKQILERSMIGFVHRSFNFVIYSNISTVFWWYSFSHHRVYLLCVLFGFVGLILVLNLNWRPFRQNGEHLLSNPSPFTPYPSMSMIFLLVAFCVGYFILLYFFNSSQKSGRNVSVGVSLEGDVKGRITFLSHCSPSPASLQKSLILSL